MIHGNVRVYRPAKKGKKKLKLVKEIRSESINFIEPEWGRGADPDLIAMLDWRKDYQARSDIQLYKK